MGNDESEANPLTSTQKSSDSLTAVLHPLVLLTISDYITRHTLRQQQGPVVGALLGQQNGREVTIEHAFDVLIEATDNGVYQLNQEWFLNRLDQMKTVHKDRMLDLVGYYALLPRSGPTPEILKLHDQVLEQNESALLLAFHAHELLEPSVGGKLPVTVYESVSEVDDASKDGAQSGSEDRVMKDGGEATYKMKFRELPYTVETGEAELISMDFVAQGATNAAAVDGAGKGAVAKKEVDPKGKGRAVPDTVASNEAENALSREDEELISTLTAKANAIKMLHSRIRLITTYLEQLPPSYLSGEDETPLPSGAGVAAGAQDGAAPSHTILRSIQALVNHIPLLQHSAAESEAFEHEMLSESNDVHLVSLFSDVMQSVQEIRDMGKKHGVLEAAKNAKANRPNDFSSPSGSFLGTAGDIMV